MISEPFSFSIDKIFTDKTVLSLHYTPPDKSRIPLSLSIVPELGSNMFSLRYGGKELIVTDPTILRTAGYTGTYVLFPTPNRVHNFTYAWKGRHIRIKKYGKMVTTHHQLVFDQPWKWTDPTISDDHVSVTTYIRIDRKSPLFEGYPFSCTLSLEYRLFTTCVRISYTVTNNGTEELPFGFGLHPHFARLSGNANTYITIPARSWMEAPPDTLLPTGRLIDVTNKPYNVQSPRPVGKLSLDHVYTNILPNQFAVIDYKTQGFKIQLCTSEDFTHIVAYTGNPDAICIENQTCSTDAHNLYARGYIKESHLMTVPQKQSHTGFISYEF